MYQWIIAIVLVILGIVGIIVAVKSYDWDDVGAITAILSLFTAAVLIAVCIIAPIADRQETSVFISQKQYIGSHISKNSVEDAALTTEKIKLNNWLYNAQYWVNNYPNWTFMPKEVKNLTPIN